MSCSSTRQIGVSNNGNAGPLTNIEIVTCMKPGGHKGAMHRGVLGDLTEIEWEGAPSEVVQPELDFG